MVSIHAKSSLAEVIKNLIYGEFKILINEIKIHRHGLELHITWTVEHDGESESKTSVMSWGEPLLQRFGYYHQNKDFNAERFAETLIATLDIEHEKESQQLVFSFMQDGEDILLDYMRWSNEHNCFM